MRPTDARRLLIASASLGILSLMVAPAFTPTAAAGNAPVYVIGAAGDLTGDHLPWNNVHRGQYDDVSDLAMSMRLDKFLVLGDAQHNWGTLEEYMAYYDSSFGRLKGITAPVTGNHDYYKSATAEGFFDYFGEIAHPPLGYYSFDLGTWHIIALNSELCAPQLTSEASWGWMYYGPGTPEYEAQVSWLQNDLATHPHARYSGTIAFWHHPLTYNSWVKPLWDLLYQYGTDIVLNGHDHNYQRWAPMDPDMNADAKGIREFVVGTGGYYLNENYYLKGQSGPPSTYQAGQSTDFGLLKLVLRPGSYDFEFWSIDGKVLDSGYGVACH